MKILTIATVFAVALAGCRTTNQNSDIKDDDVQNQAAAMAANQGPQFKVIVQTSLEPEIEALAADELAVCSFNVSFVGHWKARDKKSEELAKLLEPCDVIAMQELVAPPTNIGVDAKGEVHTWLDMQLLLKETERKDDSELIEQFVPWWTDTSEPKGLVEKWEADYQAFHFVAHMKKAGFDYVISIGDSGKSINHNNSTSSEWHIAFYRPGKIKATGLTDMPSGWTKMDDSEPLVLHPIFDRVPYAFAFRTQPRSDGKQLDFVLINVHLHSTQTRQNENEKQAGLLRANELFFINKWVEKMHASSQERDFITLGDMNIVSCGQLDDVRTEFQAKMKAAAMKNSDDIISLNRGCQPTNISVKDPKPFDQVMFSRKHTSEITLSNSYGADLIVANIAEKYGLTTTFNNVVGNFVKSYSDHMPLLFVMKIGKDDD